jgi:predicted dehydrogenase
MARIREILNAGTIGEVRSLIADHTQDLPDDPSHRINDLALGGGALLDLGIYPLSFASALFGTPATVQATATFKETGADASVATLFGYGDGRIATTLSASDTRGPNRATILGTEGRIEIDAVWYTPTSFTVYDAEGEAAETYESKVTGRGMQFQVAELERLVAEGTLESSVLPHAEMVSIMGTLDEVRGQIGLVYPTD